jgi:ATP-binding cassette, subfamily B, bacterial
VAASYLAVFGYLGAEAAAGRLALADITASVLAIGVLTNGILVGRDDLNVGWGAASLAAVRDLEEFARLQPKPTIIGSGDGPVTMACRDLGYAYPNGRRVFDSLNLALVPGQSVAIVGENGAGKTTLARLLAGLSLGQQGAIEVDGIPLGSHNLAVWQRQVAVLFQDFVHYDATLRDNVVFGAPSHRDDRSGFERSCAQAGLQDLIRALPQGIETRLSSQFEGGVDLSGGQWQRVALARALFAIQHGARLLILDEPAASLDVAAEVELYDRVLELASNVTTVVVSHRLAAVRHADRIVVLEDGAIVEDGSDTELVALGGRYAQMFALQAQRFEAGEGD